MRKSCVSVTNPPTACTSTRMSKLRPIQHANVPVTLSQGMESKLICNLCCVHCIGQILLVCEDKQHGITKFVLFAWMARVRWTSRTSAFFSSLQRASHSGSVRLGSTYLVEHAMQLVPGFTDTITVVAVHHENQTLRVLEVMSPERSDLRASSHAFRSVHPAFRSTQRGVLTTP